MSFVSFVFLCSVGEYECFLLRKIVIIAGNQDQLECALSKDLIFPFSLESKCTLNSFNRYTGVAL